MKHKSLKTCSRRKTRNCKLQTALHFVIMCCTGPTEHSSSFAWRQRQPFSQKSCFYNNVQRTIVVAWHGKNGKVQSSSVQVSSFQCSSVQSSPFQFTLVHFSSDQSSSVQFRPLQFSSVQSKSVHFSSGQFSSVLQFTSTMANYKTNNNNKRQQIIGTIC